MATTEQKDSTVAVPTSPMALPPLTDGHGGWTVIVEVIRVSFESLLANRTRSILTMLGVIIGVASVVALVSLGQGATNSIASEVEALGSNLIFVLPGSSDSGGPAANISANLTREDVDAIAALKLPLNGISPEFTGSAPVVAPAANANAAVVGVTPAYMTVNNLTMASGRFFDDGHVRAASPVAVLGSTLATDLFGKGAAVGQRIRINNQVLFVIGVLASKGGSSFGSVDNRVFVPITLAQQQLFPGRTPDGNSYRVSGIILSAKNRADIDGIKDRIAVLLRDRHNLEPDGSNDDFTIFDQGSFLTALNSIMSMLTLFLSAIAAISLVVGGIGIMNIMLVSVTERTREIGLRKAVGAQPRDILLQFVVEAVVISVTGGLIGLGLAGAVTTAITLLGALEAPITLSAVILAVGFSTAIGLFFGIYPAKRAASLNPIDALRHE